ncbi:MAG: S9 family peptidase [Anaerolineaceae bacterium]|nr:S9 family peptidase [Anaerolineaceae bacterium]
MMETTPKARRTDFEEVLHGVTVPDPYRWMEDIDSDEVRAWIEAENVYTDAFFADLPVKEKIQQRMTELWNYEKYGVPFRRGGRVFFLHNDGLQNQSVLFWQESLEDEPKELIDPNRLSEDGTVAMNYAAVSPDGRWIAYQLAQSGSDWNEIRVRGVDSGEDTEDHLSWVKFSGISWTKDCGGFYYSRYDEPKSEEAFRGQNYYQKLYYHRLGTAQEMDELVYHREDQKEWGFSGLVSDDGRYLINLVWQGTAQQNDLFYQDLEDESGEMIELLTGFEAEYEFVGNVGSTFYLLTDLDAPFKRIVAVDVNAPEKENWQMVVAESKDLIAGASLVAGRLLLTYLVDAKSELKVVDLSGALLDTPELPGIGTVSGFGGKADDEDVFYSFTNFTTPGTIYRYDVLKAETTLFRAPELNFDPKAFVTEQVFYPSKDGTMVPMFITHKKGLVRDGQNPTYLYGYGGFNIPMAPTFSVTQLVWMEMGGVFAMACLRGGGEYGTEWHEAGMKLNKQNVFDDFIAAAEFLIEHQITSPAKLGIGGRSNGGLLVGACLTQRPDLYGACLPSVGVMDMLRFHQFTIGWAWVSDYGSPDNEDEFKAIHAYSPYHNLREGVKYPPTLITTADHDDRVFPAHSFKFAAQMQHAQAGGAPVLIRIESKAGHGMGKPLNKIIEDYSDQISFLAKHLGVTV